MTRLSLHVVAEHGADRQPYGCAFIRDLLPLGHPANRDAFSVTSTFGVAPADIIIVERALRHSATLSEAENLLERARRYHACIVYSLDDNLLDLEALADETRSIVRLFCREADGVVVATRALAARLHRLNRRVYVVPNALDERLFFAGEADRPQTRRHRKTIGYMGTFTHSRDLMTVLQPLREVLRRARGGVELEIVGGLEHRGLMGAFDGLPAKLLEVPPEDVVYPRFVAWMRRNLSWDVAIAPLEDCKFNRYKSDIKFLDYGALGFAGVYSAVPSYAETVRHMETGLLAANDPAPWVEALSSLLTDDEQRCAIAGRAQEHVRATRTLSACAHTWRDALLEIYQKLPQERGQRPHGLRQPPP